MTAIARAAERELGRFFRSREGFWILAGLGALLALPLPLLAVSFVRQNTIVELDYFLEAGEVTRNVLGLLEVTLLAALAYYLAERSLREEVEDGSWLLLRLTPVPVRRLLLGKAFGVAAVLMAVHGYGATLLLTYTPFLRRTHAEVWVELLGYYLIALSFVPEGFAYGSIGRHDRRSPAVYRVGTLLRLGTVGLLFQARGASGLHGIGRGSLAGVDLREHSPLAQLVVGVIQGRSSAGGLFLDTDLPWAAVLLWLAVSGLGIWHYLVVRQWTR